jgi:dTDP-4-dehydrorhamnose reductase
MDEISVLLTGADGQLGRALQDLMPGSYTAGQQTFYRLIPFAHHERRYKQSVAGALDITHRDAVRVAVAEAKPDIVINAAAWTDTVGCEHDPERAMLVNCEGARHLANAARDAGAALVQVSTNEVFDGTKTTPYDEDNATNAINAYGRSKLAGEDAVREATDRHYIVRTSWVYGPGRMSFPEKVLANARKGKPLRGVTDETASPTLTLDLAQAIVQLMTTEAFGTYHLTNSGDCSRKKWAEEVLRLAGIDAKVAAATQAEFGVRKPVYSTLANSRAAALGITLRPWRDALAEYMTLNITSKVTA